MIILLIIISGELLNIFALLNLVFLLENNYFSLSPLKLLTPTRSPQRKIRVSREAVLSVVVVAFPVCFL